MTYSAVSLYEDNAGHLFAAHIGEGAVVYDASAFCEPGMWMHDASLLLFDGPGADQLREHESDISLYDLWNGEEITHIASVLILNGELSGSTYAVGGFAAQDYVFGWRLAL